MDARQARRWTVPVAVLCLAGCATPEPPLSPSPVASVASRAVRPELTAVWFGPACEVLRELLVATPFPDARVTVNCVAFGEWHDTLFDGFEAGAGADLPILDSQFIGEAVAGGHLVELTDWLPGNVDVADYDPTALAAYGEYPPGSGRSYGVPLLADAMMLVYRQDLFADTEVRAAFRAATGRELAVPATWTELLEVARFFNDSRWATDGFATHWCTEPACYDAGQTAWNEIAWSFGGQLWDPATYRVEGVLDGARNEAALALARALVGTGAPDASGYGFEETVRDLCTGNAALGAIWFSFGPRFTDASACPRAASLGFAVPPGEAEHVVSLGGQGLHVSAYSPHREQALAFVRWLSSAEMQAAWARAGGLSARRSVLDSAAFQAAQPYHAPFAEAYGLVRDFWNLPEYFQLLAVQGRELGAALAGDKAPAAALSAMAAAQQAILDAAYPDGPPE
jgi:multiple sugar transport system substrate-binding protein